MIKLISKNIKLIQNGIILYLKFKTLFLGFPLAGIQRWSRKTKEERINANKRLIESSIGFRFKKGEHKSKETEFKKGQIPHNKGKEHLAGVKNPMYGKPPPKGSGRGKGGYREDLGHYCRSTWEANVCRILKSKGIKYEYEPKRFHFEEEGQSYAPDLYLIDSGEYIEVKGQLYKEHKQKLDLFKKHYPKIILRIIDIKLYKRLIEQYKDKIKNWEIPTKKK